MMPDDIWDAFPETVEVTQGERPMKRPSEKDLAAAERALEMKLPRGYRSFVERFGTRTLTLEVCPCEWQVWAPGNPKNRFNSSLEERNKPYRAISPADWSRASPEPVRASRLVYFAEAPLSLNTYGWDAEDVTDPDARDYGIYSFDGRSKLELLPRVAESFADFIMGYCLDRHPREVGYSEGDWKKFESMRSYHRH
jgi:hypothetical protein